MVPKPLIVRPIAGFGAISPSITTFPENLRHLVGGVTVAVWSASAAPSSVKDDAGNSYTLVTTNTFFSNNTTSLWYLPLVYGNPQKLTVTFAAAQSHAVAAIQWDQPLVAVSSGTEAGNVTNPTVGPLTVKSGEEVLFGLTQHSNLTAGFTPVGCIVLTQSGSQGAVYAYPPTRKVIWAVNPSTGGTSSVGMFRAAPLLTNQYAFDRIMKFPGIIPVADASGTWSDTLTWTAAGTATEVEAFFSQTLTWTDAHVPTGDDEVPNEDTTTWSDSFDLASTDVTLEDTLTWSQSIDVSSSSASMDDTLTWTEEYAATSVDADLADTLTWTQDFDANTLAELEDTLTWYGRDTVVEDGDVEDTLTFDDATEGLPEIEAAVFDLVLWSDEAEQDLGLANTVTWLDRFFYDGELFPDQTGTWSDTITWDMRGIEAQTLTDTVTWTDELTLPVLSVALADTLTWSAFIGADPNLLGAARYRR